MSTLRCLPRVAVSNVRGECDIRVVPVDGRRGTCIAFGNMRIDAAVSAEVLRAIAPFGLETSMRAISDRERDGAERLRQIELALQLWGRRAIAEQVSPHSSLARFRP